ncbi:MAG TPA: MarR family transcriptional regulator [Verrucomicrobiae bacterium]
MKSPLESAAARRRYDALLQLLGTADAIWNASRVFFAAWDLSPSQFNVLNLLRGVPGGISQTELSRRLITHRSNVTGLADRLERRGLVSRQDVAGDRRAYRVVLTRSGAELLKQILPEYHARADALWRGLSLNHVSRLTSKLQALARNAERIAMELPERVK